MKLADAEARRKRGLFQKAINRKLQDLANDPGDFKLRAQFHGALYGLIKTQVSTVGATLKTSQLVPVQTISRIHKELRRFAQKPLTLLAGLSPNRPRTLRSSGRFTLCGRRFELLWRPGKCILSAGDLGGNPQTHRQEGCRHRPHRSQPIPGSLRPQSPVMTACSPGTPLVGDAGKVLTEGMRE